MLDPLLASCLLSCLPLTHAAPGARQLPSLSPARVVPPASVLSQARHGRRGARAQFGVIAPALLLISVVCIWTEVLVFVPQLRQGAVSGAVGAAVMYLAFAAVIALLAGLLKLTRPIERTVPHRPAF